MFRGEWCVTVKSYIFLMDSDSLLLFYNTEHKRQPLNLTYIYIYFFLHGNFFFLQNTKHKTQSVLGCPYEGPVDPDAVMYVSEALFDMGCYEISLGDTIGTGNVGTTSRLLDRLLDEGGLPPERLAVSRVFNIFFCVFVLYLLFFFFFETLKIPISKYTGIFFIFDTIRLIFFLLFLYIKYIRDSHVHVKVNFHDTFGQALANILISLQRGINVVDTAVAGLGGCPYAKGASGNVATEDVVYMLNGMGIKTGIDLEQVVHAGRYITDALGKTPASRAATAILAKGLHDY